MLHLVRIFAVEALAVTVGVVPLVVDVFQMTLQCASSRPASFAVRHRAEVWLPAVVENNVSAEFVVVLEAHRTERTGEELATGVLAEVPGVPGFGFEALGAEGALNNCNFHYWRV